MTPSTSIELIIKQRHKNQRVSSSSIFFFFFFFFFSIFTKRESSQKVLHQAQHQSSYIKGVKEREREKERSEMTIEDIRPEKIDEYCYF